MTTPPTDTDLREAVRRLGLHGVLARWEEVRHHEWLPVLVGYEQAERQRRSLDRRLRFARLGAFKPLCDFDWQWPKKIDRAAVEELSSLEFLTETANVVLIGPNSTGKTTIAKNLAHLALLGCDLAQGYHVSRPMPSDAFADWIGRANALLAAALAA